MSTVELVSKKVGIPSIGVKSVDFSTAHGVIASAVTMGRSSIAVFV